jgi:hypothetical protein
MTEEFKQVLAQAEGLSTEERAELAYFLLRSLDADPETEAIKAEWLAVAKERIAEMRSGKAIGRPGEEVLAELRRLYP